MIFSFLIIAGCDGGMPDEFEATFAKDALIISVGNHKLSAGREAIVGLDNGQESYASRWVDGRLIFPIPWQPGREYQVRLDDQTWTGRAPQNPTPFIWSVRELGKLEQSPTVKEWSPAVYEDVAVSPDGRYVGVASFDHNVYMYDATGKKMWEYRIPEGVGVAIAFSADNSFVYVGESSAEGNVYAFNVLTGELVWQYALANDIGGRDSARWNSRPKVTNLAVNGNRLIVSAEYTQRVTESNGERAKVQYVTACVVRALDGKNGAAFWRYPAVGSMDTGVSRISVSADGGKVAFANHSWSRGKRYLDGSVRVLNGHTGEVAAYCLLDPKGGQFSYVGIFDGISLSPDGNYLAVVTADNRGMLFDAGAVDITGDLGQVLPLIWQRQISKIQEVGGVPVYAYGNTAHVGNDGRTFFMTGATFVADKTATSAAPPFLHPDATTMFAYDRGGELIWRWQSEGGISKLRFSRDARYAVVPVYHNYVSRQKERAGIYCLDLKAAADPLVWFYSFEGVAVAAGLDAGGGIIAGIEIPVRQMEDQPLGKHRLHILQ